MTIKESLSWGLVIITYQREKILPVCLNLAVKQTRKPTEVIVIDASDDWENTRNKVMAEVASKDDNIHWIYAAAEQRSTTLQRNQGIQLATADILFLIDDDSLMYPNCAEQIMQVYEADTDRVVMGVQANIVSEPPALDTLISDSKQGFGISEKLLSGYIKRLLWKYEFLRHLFIMDAKEHFIPYDGSFPEYQLPDTVRKLNLSSTRIFDGYRMTYRREVILQEIFEPLFHYYAVAEDSDASYRVSRHGALATALDAKLHHFQSGSGRLSPLKVSALLGLNLALCLRKHSNDLKRDQQKFYRLLTYLMLVQMMKDIVNRRWSLPKARGLLVTLQYAPKLFAMQHKELAEWYPRFQHDLINS